MSRQVYFAIKGNDLDNDMFNTTCAAFALIPTATSRTKETTSRIRIRSNVRQPYIASHYILNRRMI
jgi:hypothetical protein